MSSNPNIYSCCLKWTMYSPFEPRDYFKTEVIHGMPKVKKGHVMLKLIEDNIDNWNIGLSIILNTWPGEDTEIVGYEIATFICLNEREILDIRVPSYTFNLGNRYEYSVETSTLMFAQIEKQHITVIVEFFLERNLQRRLETNLPHVSVENNLRCLSKDLYELLNSSFNYNVYLYSSENEQIRAHSYILIVRWSQLFRRHNFDTVANTVVRTNISVNLLADILVYMYSSMKPGNIPNPSPQYMAELFQVIDYYKIYHLYRVFFRCNLLQQILTKKQELTKFYVFRLHYVNNEPINDASINIYAHESIPMPHVPFHPHDFILQIQVRNRNKAGVWLSYSLLSKSKYRAHAQVKFEIVHMRKREELNASEIVRRIPAYACNHGIGPNASVNSGPILFLGCPTTFSDFPTLAPPEKIQQWFRFKISFTDGLTEHVMQHFENDSRSELERLEVLSNHMYELLSQEIHADISLLSQPEEEIHRIHKAILTARVPQWYGVMVDRDPENLLPYVAKIDLSKDALPYVLDYIYTGKIINFPQHLLEEISDFAVRGNIEGLKNIARRSP